MATLSPTGKSTLGYSSRLIGTNRGRARLTLETIGDTGTAPDLAWFLIQGSGGREQLPIYSAAVAGLDIVVEVASRSVDESGAWRDLHELQFRGAATTSRIVAIGVGGCSLKRMTRMSIALSCSATRTAMACEWGLTA